jgi:hypothetical protein
MHLDYGTDLNDMQSYMKLKIPAGRNVTETRLIMSQPTQKLSLTRLYNKLHSVFYVFFPFKKNSVRHRRVQLHLRAYLGVPVIMKGKVNAMATLSVPEVTLLNTVTSDHLA